MAELPGGITLSQIDQVGIVVRDLDRAMEYYTSTFGIGPFRIVKLEREGLIRGKVTSFHLRLAIAQVGSVAFELIQSLDDVSIHNEQLAAKGEGLHHLGFYVEDMEAKIAELGKRGIGVLQSARTERGGFAYMDTEGVAGVIFELIQRAPQS